jgi:uncharacterized membrane protein YphA (DoxX/SURF4 family)
VELALRLILAFVLLWAGIAKARNLGAFRDGLAAFGLPPRARATVAPVVATVEIALGAALLFDRVAAPAAWAAAALSVGFLGALAVARARGHRRLACHCFGGERAHHTGLLMARAALVGALALTIAFGAPQPGRDALIAGAIAVLAVAVAVLTVLVLALYRQVGVLSQRLSPGMALEIDEEGPALNTPSPPLEGLAGRGAELVAFVSANCRLCHELVPAFDALDRDGLAVRPVQEDESPEVFDRWNVPGTPFVALVIDGVVRAKGLVNTLEQIDGLVETGRERARGGV